MGISQGQRNKFPVLRTGIYVNTATSGILSEDVLEWRQEHDLDFLLGGSAAKSQTYHILKETREALGKFFNLDSDNVALVPGFSQGLNLLLEGLSKTEKVVLLEGDYPSLNWPFENRGFPITYVTIGEQLEERIYNRIKEDNCTVFACSLVQWLNGLKIDFDFLKRLKKDFPELMIIADGTQFCGTEYFDFTASGIDILGASGYKWMLAGYGNGFLLTRPEIHQRFTLKSMGYGSGRNAKHLNGKRTFCKHLEPGHLDSLSFGTLRFSLQFLTDIGMDAVGEQNDLLSKMAKTAFTELNLLDNFITLRGGHSTIFNIKGNDRLFKKLEQENVVCAQRGDGIRISFHFYNVVEELTEIIKIVKKG